MRHAVLLSGNIARIQPHRVEASIKKLALGHRSKVRELFDIDALCEFYILRHETGIADLHPKQKHRELVERAFSAFCSHSPTR
jgi:hypothetical protein